MTKKRHRKLLNAAATLRNAFQEMPHYPGEKGKHYGIYFRKNEVGFGVGEQFYNTLGFVEEMLVKAESMGFVK